MTEVVNTAMLLEEQRKTNALLEKLIAVLYSGEGARPENCIPPESLSEVRKKVNKYQNISAKDLLIKHIPHAKNFLA